MASRRPRRGSVMTSRRPRRRCVATSGRPGRRSILARIAALVVMWRLVVLLVILLAWITCSVNRGRRSGRLLISAAASGKLPLVRTCTYEDCLR
jgi:hypothetical protein